MVYQNNSNSAAESDFGYGKILAILLRRRLWFLVVFANVVAIAVVSALLEDPTYESTMQLLVEPNYQTSQNQLGAIGDQPQADSEEDYATQLNLMRSQQFLQKTVESLKTQYPDLEAGDISRSLELSQVTEEETQTKIFRAVYTSDDPIKTQEVLEALQKVYLEYNLQQQELRLSRGLEAINKQLQEAREDLANSQGNLEGFLQRHALIQPDQQASAVIEALSRVQQEQQTTRAQYEEANARYGALQRQIALTPQSALISARLSQSPRYQFLLSEVQKTDVALAEQQAIYTDADLNVQVLLDRRQNQLRLLQEEIARVVGSAREAIANENQILRLGQLSETDLELVGQLVELQTNLLGLRARSQSLATAEQQLRSELSRLPSLIAEYERLQPEVESERTAIQQLLALRQELSAQLTQGGFNWQVVEAPEWGRKIAPNPRVSLLMGIVIGLFLGGIAAFIREVTDDVIHTPEDLAAHVKLSLLGTLSEVSLPSRKSPIPFRRTQSQLSSSNLVQKLTLLREPIDFIYKNIQLQNQNSQFNSLIITSTLPNEGKSTVAIGLALSATRLGQRVLLIDANLRSPAIQQYLQCSNEKGLSNVLADPSMELRPTPISVCGVNIDLLTSGPLLEDSVRLLSSYQAKDLMQKYVSEYDLVILDTPPVLGSVDTLQIASICDGVLLVGRIDHITKAELTQAVTLLQNFNVIGVLANGSKEFKGIATSMKS
ncbi:polysaccharide biosynthesis tyrosine autokinase [Oscillatoria sp. FACHB-1407]|uniref:GumC family protein n=1 Tax=Oscillatoria sp. FACHB-1407 TaxID=2692847 RepID=UPI0016842C6E|nr:polysaccharide biosynthesis tyrosine autokinase [Oscillatoria sp. FACHB-1407]MBD2459696.1 polysaccharide biosynthesis tyrosine autokinase [Oscillatoria sp. FACHB-1407]